MQCFYIFLVFKAESPSAGKFTAIALYLVTSLFFLVGAFIESIFILHLQQANEDRLMVEQHLLKWKSLTKKMARDSITKNTVQTIKSNVPKVNIKRIDIIAFFISGALFLAFNITYWIYYQFRN